MIARHNKHITSSYLQLKITVNKTLSILVLQNFIGKKKSECFRCDTFLLRRLGIDKALRMYLVSMSTVPLSVLLILSVRLWRWFEMHRILFLLSLDKEWRCQWSVSVSVWMSFNSKTKFWYFHFYLIWPCLRFVIVSQQDKIKCITNISYL